MAWSENLSLYKKFLFSFTLCSFNSLYTKTWVEKFLQWIFSFRFTTVFLCVVRCLFALLLVANRYYFVEVFGIQYAIIWTFYHFFLHKRITTRNLSNLTMTLSKYQEVVIQIWWRNVGFFSDTRACHFVVFLKSLEIMIFDHS